MGYAVLCALLSLASLAFIALTALWMHRGQQRRAEIGIGTTTGVNTELAGRLYESRGFERVGAVYRMGA